MITTVTTINLVSYTFIKYKSDMAFSNGKNPFMDDPDDDIFPTKSRSGASDARYGSRFGPESGDPPPYEDDMRGYGRQQQVQQSMNRQLDTTQRCLASIYESEQIGIDTAEDLVRQGEQLDNVESKVDKINADTKVSQRHLNSIKSIFGGIRNWWSGEGKNDTTPQTVTSSRDRTTLRQAVATERETPTGDHPAFRIRGNDVSGFYDEDIVEFGSSGAAARPAPRIRHDYALQPSVQTQARSQQWQDYEKNLSTNLEQMSSGVSRLKNLAVGLGDEISAQNDQLDRIAPKVERADTKIRDQNRQMRHILGK